MQRTDLGAYFLRGDNVAIVAKVEQLFLPSQEIFGDPLPPMQLSWGIYLLIVTIN